MHSKIKKEKKIINFHFLDPLSREFKRYITRKWARKEEGVGWVTLESSRRAFSRRSGLLSSRTSCSAEAILRSLVAWVPAAELWAEPPGEGGGGAPPPKAAFIDSDWGRFVISNVCLRIFLRFFFSFPFLLSSSFGPFYTGSATPPTLIIKGFFKKKKKTEFWFFFFLVVFEG